MRKLPPSAFAFNIATGEGSNNLWLNLGYNPASQLITRQFYNAAYNWPYSAVFVVAYASNGLNEPINTPPSMVLRPLTTKPKAYFLSDITIPPMRSRGRWIACGASETEGDGWA